PHGTGHGRRLRPAGRNPCLGRGLTRRTGRCLRLGGEGRRRFRRPSSWGGGNFATRSDAHERPNPKPKRASMTTSHLISIAGIAMSLLAGSGHHEGSANARAEEPQRPDASGNYATVNGLRMYYETRGEGEPLVLLHGAFGLAMDLPALAKNRRVIAVELQGHGHTADIDRPLSVEQMADDTAALLKELKIERADFFGYSMGGVVALGVAIRHPSLVRKLAINGSYFGSTEAAFEPEAFKQFRDLPADFAPPMLKAPYDKVAPDPTKWPTLVAKIKKAGMEFKGFARDDLKAIKAPVLITLGDRDGIRPEHVLEMFRLIPGSELAIIPGADHFLIFQSPEKLLPTIAAFFEAPVSAKR